MSLNFSQNKCSLLSIDKTVKSQTVSLATSIDLFAQLLVCETNVRNGTSFADNFLFLSILSPSRRGPLARHPFLPEQELVAFLAGKLSKKNRSSSVLTKIKINK